MIPTTYKLDRKMCAGVFGPSQAGKSYLISALARDTEGNLQARFGAEMHDFISEINPEGGKESTGLVTRFTMTRPESLPEGCRKEEGAEQNSAPRNEAGHAPLLRRDRLHCRSQP